MNRQKLVDDINKKKRELELAESALAKADRNCGHVWGDAVAAHIRHEGYTIPGDPPGTMGVDHRGPTYVSPRTEKRWKRVCQKCGKVEYTSRVAKETKVIEKPRW